MAGLANFSFVRPYLAGLAKPGPDQAPALKDAGITLLVTLTEEMPENLAPALETAGVKSLHLPVVDFKPPTIDQLETFSKRFEEEKASGGKVAVHCMAGKGRTGTFLAAALLYEGCPSADVAIKEIRSQRPGSIEAQEQEEVVASYAKFLEEKHTAKDEA
mmetsp:Transcript_66628/g.139086  ORF Transcript_66628/g.139086 Transcript_66628/m.139086 type:complete len:160 (-) Transcript_66628:134-613(-)|eukprot:CAMPEP_0206527374 /NCGR_PEP_ID=MMETSP0325_2-20121206/1309_1 /ASSEMBLY_ACC=CAM_ASM_000347 /TAXON_ID=2866 /ORGANISM="Crypthecodinium cohnii, Strain Seligo" /LENGTH=159 /DNA_ID=CAMNT_0054022769 /DNA_START=27 /DNA_END=506 /DNA_ORIENTATION=-